VRLFIFLVVLVCCSSSYARDYAMRESLNGPIQGAATSSLKTFLVTDNFSHTVPTTGWLWANMNYNGAATCQVRYMNTSNKSLYPAQPVASGSQKSTVINDDHLFYNYTGCFGQTGNNSVVEVE